MTEQQALKEIAPLLLEPVNNLGISVRAKNCLSYMKILYVGQLIQLKNTDLLYQPNSRSKTMKDINAELQKNNIKLQGKLFNLENYKNDPDFDKISLESPLSENNRLRSCLLYTSPSPRDRG